jgi:predicted outer membrane repeat protein
VIRLDILLQYFAAEITRAGLIGELHTILAPRVHAWPNVTSPGNFVDVHDWDVMVFTDGGTSYLTGTIRLCRSIFPCKLDVVGTGPGVIERTDGSISCLLSAGCLGVTLESLNVVCGGNVHPQSLFIIQGSAFTCVNVSFYGCSSATDGGIVKSYDSATLVINSSRFDGARSLGFGGALVVLGSSAFISNTRFRNCSASLGGGAIWAVWASVFQCYGSDKSDITILHIDRSSSFTSCASGGQGGSILLTLDSATLSASFGQDSANRNDSQGLVKSMFVRLEDTTFRHSKSGKEGGALAVSSMYAAVNVYNVTFAHCSSASNGGAIYAGNEASINLSQAHFHDNTADGIGGGAIYSQNARLMLLNITSTNNLALAGGGGLLFWGGDLMPQLPIFSCGPTTSWPAYSQGGISSLVSTACTRDSRTPATPLVDLIAEYICGPGNRAMYGPCIASDGKTLQSSYTPALAYPGLPISILVTKKDAYDQTIVSDSASVIQVFPSAPANPDFGVVRVTGNTIARFAGGLATISLAIGPIFASIDFYRGTTALQFEPRLYLSGPDSQTGLAIQSDPFRVGIQSGRLVCPGGYVLDIDIPGGPAECTFCKAGTYSINPLAPQSGSASSAPACLNCPSGGDCSAGADIVTFAVGTWVATDQMYLLVGCPPGHQLVNTSADGRFSHALQECRKCLAGQYIVRSDVDSCQPCPAGEMGVEIARFPYTGSCDSVGRLPLSSCISREGGCC